MPPRTEHVISESSTFQHFDALRRNRNLRHRQRTLFVEGVRQIDRLIAHDWTVRSFLYRSDAPHSSWAERLLASSDAEVHYALPSRLHRKLSGKNDASELFALVAMPDDDLERIPSGADLPLIVVVDRPGSPGNLGTLIRSCDALGVDGVVMSGHAVDLYDPETIAASTGSLFALPVVRTRSHQELIPLFDRIRRDHGDLQLIGTSAHASRSVDACSFWRPTVLLIGNEAKGLSRAYQELVDTTVSIPMQGSATSLNVACATSILLYEIQRQRVR
jgi:TrmH family RNA methyltransferase